MEMAGLPLELLGRWMPAGDGGGKQDMSSAVIRYWTQFWRKSVFSSSAIHRKTIACKVELELDSRERQRWGRSCLGLAWGAQLFPPISLWSNQGNVFAFCVRSEEPGSSPPSLALPAFRQPHAQYFNSYCIGCDHSLGNPDLYCQ